MLTEQELNGSYYLYLVIISVMVAILASYASINLASKIEDNSWRDRWILLVSSAVMGGGIWTMHFIGMEAYHLDIPVTYDIRLVILSFFLPVVSTMFSYWLFWQNQKRKSYLSLSSVIMGLGIAGMHYTGMKSMEMDAKITYDPILLLASIAIAILVSIIGFRFFLKYIYGNITKKISGSIIFGIAVSSMHYIGMSAATFTSQHHGITGEGHISNYNSLLAFSTSIFIIFMFIVILVTSVMDERFTSKLKESEEQYRQLVELSPIGIAIHHFGDITYMNPTGLQILGARNMEEISGRNILDFIHPDYHEIVRTRWKILREKKRTVKMIEEKMVRLDKEIIDVEMKGIPITRNGESGVQIFFYDITDRKKAEKLVYQMAYHDPLTELPNRRLFIARLNEILEELHSNPYAIAIMFIDLDGFKQVNDTFGHDTGDILLIHVAKRLKRSIPEEDMVSRFAGDEFAILLKFHHQNEVISIAEEIINVMNLPIKISSSEVHVTPSIGISFSFHGREDAKLLLKQADLAMYQAKKHGKNKYQIYK